MKPRSDTPATLVPGASRAAWTNALHWSAFLLLLACMATRPFLNEITYRTAAIPGAFGSPPPVPPAKEQSPEPPERMELARVTFAAAILLAVALWLAGAAANGEIPSDPANARPIRPGRFNWLTALLLLFALLSLASALCASNKRAALDAWIEQVSLLAAAVLTARLCADRRRFVMVVVVLAAVAYTLAARGFFEKWVQIPDRIAEFDKNRAEILAHMGIAEGSPQAIAMANRVRDPAVTGFIAMANVFASTLQVCVLAAAGLAAWKIAAAVKLLPAFRKDRKKGEIHLPSLAAAVAVLLAAAGGAVLIFTRSTGGIAAFAVALPVCWLVYRFRETLARRWKLCLLAFGGLLLVSMAAVAAVGLTTEGSGNLGHLRKTLLFRWLYWQASAKVVRDHPALGVGPANFGTVYLKYRDVRGEEAVKTPHNFAMQALTEYGLPGGLCYLAALGAMLTCACRPRPTIQGWHGDVVCRHAMSAELPRGDKQQPARTGRHATQSLAIFAGLSLALLLARSYFAGTADVSQAVWMMDALLPTLAMATMMVAAWWCSRLAAGHADSTLLRIALGGGVAAFLFYEVISFNLTMPSAAAVFFLAVGAMMARHGWHGDVVCHHAISPGPEHGGKQRRHATLTRDFTGNAALAAGMAALVVAVAAVLWWPVYQRTCLTEEMQQACSRQQWQTLAELADQAARADKLDPQAAADAARAYGLLPPEPANIRAAYDWAKEAIRRDPDAATWQQLAGMTCWRSDPADTIMHMNQAVTLDPQDLRLRLRYADMLAHRSQPAAALRELDAVEAIDRGLLPDSSERLRPAELEQVRQLRRRAMTAK